MKKKINFICYGVIFPALLSFIVYFGFTSKYALAHAGLDRLPELYYHGVYNYRFLSRDILDGIYVWVNPYMESLRDYRLFSAMNTLGTNFYFLTILYNTVFYVLACMILYKLFFCGKSEHKNKKYTELLYLFFIMSIALSQYVTTPFDDTSIFLFFLSVYLIFKLKKRFSILNSILLTCIVVISTCNRESSALTLSFYAALILDDSISKIFEKETFLKLIKHLSLPVVGFLVAYVGIRLFIQMDNIKIIEGNYFLHNITEFKNIFGVLFYLILTYFSLSMTETAQQKRNLINYLIFSIPYIFVIIYAGLLWEIRLYIPLLMGQFILANPEIFIRHEK
ncbi:MAG: hypothetical protein LBT29_05510 [Flavobacteriaceae bacterium]|jgi:hypothetical protein|nr:hypothetical protein [Flavobacteriaceae bacterium]